MKSIRRKLNSRGFSLTELLVTVAIIAIFSIAVTGVTNSALKSYSSSTFLSQSTSLEDTVNTAVADILRYAKSESGSKFTYEEYKQCYFSAGTDGRIYLNTPTATTKVAPLLSSGVYGKMKVTDFNLSYSGRTYSVTYKITNGTLTRDCTTYVRTL